MKKEGGASESENEKTEEATEHKKQRFKKEGNFPISREIGSFVIILSLYFITTQIAQYSKNGVYLFKICFENLNADAFVQESIWLPFWSIILLLSAICAVMILVYSAQTQFTFTTKKLAWNFKKMNIFAGLKNMFSMQILTNFIKTLAKFMILLGVIFWSSKQALQYHANTIVEINGFWIRLESLLKPIFKTICIYFFAITIFDYGIQVYNHRKKIKMYRKEIADEQKEHEGDPHIKSKQKSIRRAMLKKNIATEVPKASFVVTNPEHFAVAVKWDPKSFAPIVTAKGTDLMAQYVKTVAHQNNIPIIRQPKLARSLYFEVPIGGFIKKSHYKVVAELINYIRRMKVDVNNTSP